VEKAKAIAAEAQVRVAERSARLVVQVQAKLDATAKSKK
jgi:hypothetical protein